MSAVTLVIGHRWDGAVLPTAGRSSLRIGWADDALQIEVDAAFGGSAPPPGPAGPTAKLWEHEVVELFVVGDAEDPVRYTEIELSPHGHHLVLQLEGVRNIVAEQLPLRWVAPPVVEGDRWRAVAAVGRALLPARPVRCNAYRVAGAGPTRTWEAMVAVPGDKPDFHQLDRFAPWPL
ncbi:MAG: hypothetical protein R3F59_05360 [Myxococcota bacterium]